jgi:NAD(P)-dependent dehydrogenase (short-subunit alcohol dehydrogenase family)
MDDRVAIVTGSGTGIGAEAAKLLAAQGMTVALVGRRREHLEQVASELDGRGLLVPADLARPEAPAEIVQDVLERTDGRLDVIVNNAASFILRPFGEFSLADLDQILGVNVRAAFFLVQEALPALERSEAPCVVNVSSAAARMYRPGQAAYALSKAALEHLTKQLAAELAPRRIRVNAVMPGPTDTPIHAVGVADPEGRKVALGKMVPLGRIGEAEEVALWIAHLVDRRAAWVTGSIVEVDGGRILGPPESV